MSCRMAIQVEMFGVRPSGKPTKPKLVERGVPLWTAEKACLIDEYIHRFLLVTKHGVYLDLFAGPQRVDDIESWSVRRVLERRTEGNPSIRHYAVCDEDPAQVERLRELGGRHGSFRVYAGDANEQIHTMLSEAPIGPKTACFCLIDQRTFECHWATVEAVARHKREGFKIELFYFLAQGWLDRAWSTSRPEKLRPWWGNSDYRVFLERRSYDRANTLCRRFRDELGYEYSIPFAIQEKGEGSRTMYYMIHASDHPRAARLMSEAYRAVGSDRMMGGVQLDFFPGIQ